MKADNCREAKTMIDECWDIVGRSSFSFAAAEIMMEESELSAMQRHYKKAIGFAEGAESLYMKKTPQLIACSLRGEQLKARLQRKDEIRWLMKLPDFEVRRAAIRHSGIANIAHFDLRLIRSRGGME
jgi:hypothetical protein